MNTSHSNSAGRRVGFSTGALELGNFEAAVAWMLDHHIKNVELSALRFDELEPLVNRLNEVPIRHFKYISFHAPSSFDRRQENRVIKLLHKVYLRGWNVVVHPDVIYTPARWAVFGSHLLIENMDRRKITGRTAKEMAVLFARLPKARLCLDVAHARQLDTTLKLLMELIGKFSDRIAEIHISELDSSCRHQPMSTDAVNDYRKFARRFRAEIPVIIESMLNLEDRIGLRMDEFHLAQEAITPFSVQRRWLSTDATKNKDLHRRHSRGLSFLANGKKRTLRDIK